MEKRLKELRNSMRIFVLAASLLATTMATAATPIDGWYSGVFGGYAYLPGNIDKTTSGLTRNDAKYHWGYDTGASLGFKSNPMRYEAELTYLNAGIDNFNVNGVQQTGPVGYSESILGLANAYYDFPGITMSVQPFLGVGIGYAWVRTKLNSTGPSSVTNFSASKSVFAYQATGGLTYNFAENYALNLGYRYIGTTHVSSMGKMLQAHIANVGAVYRFDGNNYK